VWRIRGEEYDSVLSILHEVRERYNRATIYADGNGMGAPIVQRLAKQYGDGVVDRKWSSNALKTNDVTAARLLFQRTAWKFLSVPWQMQEFRLYTRTKTGNGLWKYHAPEGSDDHDDAVAAACMVAERLKNRQIVEPVKPGAPLITVEGGDIRVCSEWFAQQEGRERAKRKKWPWNLLGG
jgi:hypothetical protein